MVSEKNGERERWQLDGTCQATRLMSERLRSDIIECDDVLVIKLFSSGVTREMVEEEMRLTNLARGCGIRAPTIVGIVEDGGRWGFSYHKLHGPTILDLMLEEEQEVEELAMSLAKVHREVHEHREAGMPALKDRLRGVIEACPGRDQLRARALEALDGLPDGDRVCHGDFHPGNVINTSDGSFVLDWMDASAGHHLGDVARSLVLICAWLPNQMESMGVVIPQAKIERFYRSYRSQALGTDPGNEALLDRWMFPVAVARLCENIPGEEQRLMELIERRHGPDAPGL